MKLFWLARRRRRLARRGYDSPFKEFLDAPIPDGNRSFTESEFVSLDIETTGLDAKTAEVLSLGWVVVRHGRVDMSTCETHLVRPDGDVGDSASVHGLTDTHVGTGQDRGLVFARRIEVLTGRALVVHHAGLDKALLDRLCSEDFGCTLPVPVVDTLALALARRKRQHHVADNNSLRLADLREEYNLPYYKAHDCLVDAIATAELLIAMVANQDGPDRTRLKRLLNAK